jgi:uncharacterized protein YggT (Ycf19 family)
MTDQPVKLPEDTGTTKGLRFAKVLVWLIYAYFMLAVIILTLAFFLLLFNANSDASFTSWVYRSADRVLEPFRGIFPSATADNGSVLDFAVLFAIVVYGILAMLVHGAVEWIDGKIRRERANQRYLEEQARLQGATQPAPAPAPQQGAVPPQGT